MKYKIISYIFAGENIRTIMLMPEEEKQIIIDEENTMGKHFVDNTWLTYSARQTKQPDAKFGIGESVLYQKEIVTVMDNAVDKRGKDLFEYYDIQLQNGHCVWVSGWEVSEAE